MLSLPLRGHNTGKPSTILQPTWRLNIQNLFLKLHTGHRPCRCPNACLQHLQLMWKQTHIFITRSITQKHVNVMRFAETSFTVYRNTNLALMRQIKNSKTRKTFWI
jgi:hypothetical protein